MEIKKITLNDAKARIDALLDGATQNHPLLIVGCLNALREYLEALKPKGAQLINNQIVVGAINGFNEDGSIKKDFYENNPVLVDGQVCSAKEYLNNQVATYKKDEFKLLYEVENNPSLEMRVVSIYIAKETKKPIIILANWIKPSDISTKEVVECIEK